jgi:type II secretory pathway component PulJ
MKAWKNCRGICLAEAMIAMAAGMVVLSATVQTLDYFQKQFSKQQDEVSRHQDQRMGIRVFEEELRLAGSGASVIEPALLEAKPQAIAFRANLSQMVTTLSHRAAFTRRKPGGRHELCSVFPRQRSKRPIQSDAPDRRRDEFPHRQY